jgi:putative ABC transport system substrate-binding protein
LEILVNPDAADAEPEIGEVTAAAQTLGQRIQVLSASGDAAIETAFATLAERGVRGLFISPNAFFTNRREQIIALAARYVVPALYGWREYVVSGVSLSETSSGW